MLVLVLGAAAWAADCPEPTTAGALSSQLAAAEKAVVESPGDFAGLLSEIDETVACLGEVATPALAARLHRLHGIEVAQRDELAALPSFLAARAIEPDAALVPGVDLSASPVGEAYGSVDPGKAAKESVPAPAAGALVLDGSRTQTRGRDLPVLFQIEGADGVLASSYVGAGAPLPAYDAAPPPPVAPPLAPGEDLAEAPAPSARKGGPSKGLLWSGVGIGLLAGGLYGGALAARGDFDDLPHGVARDEAEGLQSRANTLVVASAASLGVSFGLVGTSFAVGGR